MHAQDVKDGLSALTDSLGGLLTNVERNRALMGLLTHFKASPPALAPSQRVRTHSIAHTHTSARTCSPSLSRARTHAHAHARTEMQCNLTK